MSEVKSPCCGAPLIETYLVTALCSRCFDTLDLRKLEVNEQGETRWIEGYEHRPSEVARALSGRGVTSAELKKDELDGAVTRLSAQEDPHG